MTVMSRVRDAMIVIVAASLAAGCFLAIVMFELAYSEQQQREQLVRMTNAFTAVYSDGWVNGQDVPATFRRKGIDHFSISPLEQDIEKTVRMPGTPGLEIGTIESDPRLLTLIDDLARGAGESIQEHRVEDGRLIGRSIFPSIANSQACVDCHNSILGEGTYQLGDVMGAFVVESDLTIAGQKNIGYTFGAFAIAVVGFGYAARRERRRMTQVVTSLEERLSLEEEKAAAEAQASFLASHDPLTGLANRAMFQERLQADLAKYSDGSVVLALVDLDGFKVVNDTHGHDAGDALLMAVAHRLDKIAGALGGLVARLGGDEFALVFATSSGMSLRLHSLASRIVETISDPCQHNGVTLIPSGSIGMVMAADLAKGEAAAGVLKAADAALYAAKSQGKNTYRFYDEEIQSQLGRRTRLSQALPNALTNGQVWPALQPKVDAKSGAVVGFEALARWTLDDEAIPPTEFVAIAEEYGFIKQLDLAVLNGALAFACEARQALGVDVSVSSNLSARTLHFDSIGDEIDQIIAASGVPPRCLTIEITETTMVQSWAQIGRLIRSIRSKGVRVSIDDFGTGYSSLSSLRQLPCDEIKIDRSFVGDIAKDEDSRAMLRSILDLVRAVNTGVVVEGVETHDQKQILVEEGAETIQGFLIAEPLTAAEALEFARDFAVAA